MGKTAEDWSPSLIDRRFELEAKVDVTETEILHLQARLDEGDEAEQSTKLDQMLQYGPRAQITFTTDGEKIATIDGQKVSYTPEGEPYINDPESPYPYMMIYPSYRKMSNDWTKEREKARIEKFKKTQEEARVLGKPVPSAPPVKSIKTVDRGSLPKWPEDAVRVTLNGDEK